MGIKGKDGVVFGVEKLVLSKLYEYGANKRIIHIDSHIGMVSTTIKMSRIIISSYILILVEEFFIHKSNQKFFVDTKSKCMK